MKGEINLLILDEPTNHLDLASREWIEDAVEQYDETILFISHDRYFINRFATRIWTLEDGIFTDFHGTYEEYVKNQKSQNPRPLDSHRQPVNVSRQKKEPPAGKDKKVKPSDAMKELRRIEREIEKLEAEMESVEKLKEENSSDYAKLMELDELELQLKSQLDRLLEEWERASNLVYSLTPEA